MPIAAAYLCPLLQVFDMPTSLRFYRDVLGFEIVNTSPGSEDQVDWVWLKLGECNLMLNTAYEQDDRPSWPESGRVAAHTDTSLFFGCPDVDAVYKLLLEEGIETKPPSVAPYGMKQLYVNDPDGYSLCFQWPIG